MGFPVEAKCVGGREPLETIVARYMPQLHWQMLCTGAKECALSVIMGANEPIIEIIPFDPAYADELMRRARAFMACVESLTSPVVLPKVEPPPLPVREYQMDEMPEWKALASRWLQVMGAAQQEAKIEKELKAMVPADAAKAFGTGVIITRNRAGSLALREMKSESAR